MKDLLFECRIRLHISNSVLNLLTAMFDFICPPDHIALCVGVLESAAEAVVCCHGSSILNEDYKFPLFTYLFFN